MKPFHILDCKYNAAYGDRFNFYITIYLLTIFLILINHLWSSPSNAKAKIVNYHDN
jgi:hypothetical protein